MDKTNGRVVRFDAEDLSRMNRVLRHRLGNFISGIKTSMSLVSQELKDIAPPEVAEYFPLIIKECCLLEELTKRMNLVFDDVQTGGVAPVGNVLEKVLVEVRAWAPSADIRVDFGGDDDSEMKVDGFIVLSSALIEIVKNAYESAPRGAVHLKVLSENNRVKFKIIDGGAGVPVDDLEKIFLPFYTTKSKHLGIGLTIARRLLAMINGDVSAFSGEGQGFYLEVTVPVRA